MPMCNISGYLYNAQGQVITTGILTLQLQQDMVYNSQKVVPFTITVDLSTTSGLFDKTVFPTVGASPAGIAYKLEYDPDPTDTEKPMKNKPGYFRNYIAVPDQASLSLGAIVSALRGQPSANYMPVGGSLSTVGDDLTLGTGTSTDKRIIANTADVNKPKIRYNDTANKWQFSDDGTNWQDFLQGGGGAVGGDLTGTVGAAEVAKIRGVTVSSTDPTTTGQYLRYNSGTTQYEASLDGSQLTSLNAGNLGSGTVPLARLSNITNTEISASAGIAWSKISKVGSSLADLATRSAADLSSGALPIARLTGYEAASVNSGTALTLDLATAAVFPVTMTGNCTFTLSNPVAGRTYEIILTQDGTGSRTITFPATVKWPGGTVPTWSTAAGRRDRVQLTYSSIASGIFLARADIHMS